MSGERIQAPKGVSEYLPPRSRIFDLVRQRLIDPAKECGYQLIELPVFEDTELYRRGVGESTDVVSKEMYTFQDRGGRSLTLRPEGTAGVVRAVIEHGLDRGALPVKLWYTGPFFRAERPQAGRYRQFYQVGIEAIGLDDPAIDAEVIAIADAGFKRVGLTKYRLDLTSLGDMQSRSAHRVELLKYIATLTLDEATAQRAKINPLRLFDDKREEIKSVMSKAPLLMDFLSEASKVHFQQVRRYLELMGIAYSINPKMVRGLDYYTGTTFEFVHELLGAQSGIGGGGRYDGLALELGGQPFSGIGFGLGVDRTVLAAEAEGCFEKERFAPDLFVIPLGAPAKERAILLLQELRAGALICEMAFGDRTIKSAMKAADKSGAKFLLVLGDSELASGMCELKEMSTGKSSSVTLATVGETLRTAANR